MLSNDKYKLILINSVYEVASDELNGQITTVNSLVKKVDKNAIVAGEGPLMKDLITISNKDFNDCKFMVYYMYILTFSNCLKKIFTSNYC